MEIICFLLAVQSALLFNMIILSKGVKGFLIKQKAIDKQIIFLKCNSTANSQRLSYKCEEDHHSNYGRNFGSCEKKHLIFREWNLSRELCDADNQLLLTRANWPTGELQQSLLVSFISGVQIVVFNLQSYEGGIRYFGFQVVSVSGSSNNIKQRTARKRKSDFNYINRFFCYGNLRLNLPPLILWTYFSVQLQLLDRVCPKLNSEKISLSARLIGVESIR